MWGGNEGKNKIHFVAWSKIQAKKQDGGIGVGSLKALNCALLTKWIWRLKCGQESIWKKVIMGIHNLHRKPMTSLSKKSIGGVSGNIVMAKVEIESSGDSTTNLFSVTVGNGKNTCFWSYVWVGSIPFSPCFPNPYALEKNQCILQKGEAMMILNIPGKELLPLRSSMMNLISYRRSLAHLNFQIPRILGDSPSLLIDPSK